MPLAVGHPHASCSMVTTSPNASVAQLVEQKTLNLLVLGSNPSRGTSFQRDVQLKIGVYIKRCLKLFPILHQFCVHPFY